MMLRGLNIGLPTQPMPRDEVIPRRSWSCDDSKRHSQRSAMDSVAQNSFGMEAVDPLPAERALCDMMLRPNSPVRIALYDGLKSWFERRFAVDLAEQREELSKCMSAFEEADSSFRLWQEERETALSARIQQVEKHLEELIAVQGRSNAKVQDLELAFSQARIDKRAVLDALRAEPIGAPQQQTVEPHHGQFGALEPEALRSEFDTFRGRFQEELDRLSWRLEERQREFLERLAMLSREVRDELRSVMGVCAEAFESIERRLLWHEAAVGSSQPSQKHIHQEPKDDGAFAAAIPCGHVVSLASVRPCHLEASDHILATDGADLESSAVPPLGAGFLLPFIASLRLSSSIS